MIELWLVDLDAAGSALAQLERTTLRLAADDRRRAAQLHDPDERRHRLAAYVALRVALERFAGPTVRGVKLARAVGGKPYLPGASVAFNLSHAGALALIGVATNGIIGVDLEEARVVRTSGRRRAEIVATGAGLAAAAAGDADDDSVFLRGWARLEAFAKAQGAGVARVLGDLGLRSAAGRTLSIDAIQSGARALAREAGLEVRDLKMPAGLYAAAAVPRGSGKLRVRRFPVTVAEIKKSAGA